VKVDGSAFTFSDPVSVRRVFSDLGPNFPTNNDVLRDGRFVGMVVPDQTGPMGSRPASDMQVVLNWFDELKQRVPQK